MIYNHTNIYGFFRVQVPKIFLWCSMHSQKPSHKLGRWTKYIFQLPKIFPLMLEWKLNISEWLYSSSFVSFSWTCFLLQSIREDNSLLTRQSSSFSIKSIYTLWEARCTKLPLCIEFGQGWTTFGPCKFARSSLHVVIYWSYIVI